jgi:uncharacterized Zn finger protein (UPF0148 family)
MKVCEKCGEEIYTLDGDNICADCENKKKKNAKRNAARKAREDAIRSCGLVKVKGAMGGTYWE